MQLQINGNSRSFTDPVHTVSELLEALNLGSKIVIVEHNARILQKDDHETAQLTHGDTLEIVHFVGGG